MKVRIIDKVQVKAERLIKKCQKDFTAHLTLLMFTDKWGDGIENAAEQSKDEFQLRMDKLGCSYDLIEGSLITDYVKVGHFPYYSYFVRIPSWVRLTYPELY